MTKISKKGPATPQRTHSSISVSNHVVCEDEACIGKVADLPNGTTDNDEHPGETPEQTRRPGTRMSVGGKDACYDDACIGKQ